MHRSEFAANQALATRATPAAWAKPSTCRRAPRAGFFARLLSLFR